jgi:hypothetical protein
MKHVMLSLWAAALTGGLGSCAFNEPADPDEATGSSDVTIQPRYAPGRNFVRACPPGLHLRSCDDPAGCATDTILALHSVVFSDFEDTSTHMAHLTAPAGWAATLSPQGHVVLSTVDGPCN